MTTDTSVKYFSSDMSGAPVLSGTAGTLISVLDACLVNGFGSVTINTLVVASNVATATVSAGHLLAMVGSTGPVIRIEGATPAGLNGDWRVTVTSLTTFTFATTGITDQTATGTISAKRAPAGFSKAFSGTNKAAYRADSIQSTRSFLRVDDTPNYSAACIGFTDIPDQAAFNAGTGQDPFPATSNYGLSRSNYTTATANSWVLFSDGSTFYIHNNVGNTAYYAMGGFGDIISLKSGDNFKCMLAKSVSSTGGTNANAGGDSSLMSASQSISMVMPKSYTQFGSAVVVRTSARWTTVYGQSSLLYPDLVSNSLLLSTITVQESTAIIRGLLPGLYAPFNNFANNNHHKVVVENITELPGRTLMLLAGQTTNGCVAVDITGPWR
jgi:hypothetical protein